MLSPAPVRFKANPPGRPLPALSTHALLAVEGPDAGAFLQAQLMNDVRALAVAQWQWTGWLNPKGRLVALLALLRTAEDGFLLLVPDFPVAELQARLQRYVFRSKLRLGIATDWTCAAQFDEAGPRSTLPEQAEGSAEAGWRLDMGGSALAGPADAGAGARWQAMDLAHGLPRLPAAGVEAWTPQMLSLERLRAFSLSKGCYPGQEIVARTHYLGKAKRVLVRIAGEDLREGEALRSADGREAGQVACTDPGGGEALAVVTTELADGPLQRAEGGPARRLPLEGGLARPV
jgi:tRNA-modifying protein YgfZ